MAGKGELLVQAIETSDVKAVSQLKEKLQPDGAWKAHLTLFPVVQRVVNPPFINPHLPKMYAVCRDLLPYLKPEDIPGLLYMEAMEYARRPKLPQLARGPLPKRRISFEEVEGAIKENDREKTAILLTTFHEQEGAKVLARRLLLLGSGYLTESLGHSVSCTAFILLEMLQRPGKDPWPALALLADYFCKGHFEITPRLRREESASGGLSDALLLRSTSGSSFMDIHHTITLYAIERSRHFFAREEYEHLLQRWMAFMGKKEERLVSVDMKAGTTADYATFFNVFSRLEPGGALAAAVPMATFDGRKQLGRFLVRGLCDLYQADYNPHYVTGLGAALWVIEGHWNKPPVVTNVLHQYLGFLFSGLRSGR